MQANAGANRSWCLCRPSRPWRPRYCCHPAPPGCYLQPEEQCFQFELLLNPNRWRITARSSAALSDPRICGIPQSPVRFFWDVVDHASSGGDCGKTGDTGDKWGTKVGGIVAEGGSWLHLHKAVHELMAIAIRTHGTTEFSCGPEHQRCHVDLPSLYLIFIPSFTQPLRQPPQSVLARSTKLQDQMAEQVQA